MRSQSEADKVAASGFSGIYEPVKPFLDDLDVFLQNQVGELEPEVQEQVRYVFGHSGKRLRPMLVAYSGWESFCRGLPRGPRASWFDHRTGPPRDTRARRHSGRGGYAAPARDCGQEIRFSGRGFDWRCAFAHALKLASEFPTTEVCRVVARATSRVCAGEIAQTYQRGDVNYSREFYCRVIQLKTAELFEVSCRLGAKVAGYSEKFADAAGLFGRHLGIAYQMFDDLVDLYADASMIGKTLGTDLEKGKFTLPLLLLLEKVSEKEREDLIGRFKVGDQSVAADFTTRLRDFPIFEEVVAVFEAELEKAIVVVAPFADQPPVEAMQKIAQLVRAQLLGSLRRILNSL